MWFDTLMDDLKRALIVANQYKGVFVPVFLKLAMHLIIGMIVVIGVITTITSGIFAGVNEVNAFEIALSFLVPIIVFLILGYIIYMVLWSLIEVGSINLYHAAINDEKPSKEHFFEGIKHYLGRVFGGKLLIHLVIMITAPVWMVLFVLFLILIGIPTAGWGAVFLSVAVGAFFASWTIAIVHDDLGVIDGIKASFRLAKNHFKTMFIIMLSISMVTQYAITLFGPIGIIIGGWFIGGVLSTYFKIAVYLTYMRYDNEE